MIVAALRIASSNLEGPINSPDLHCFFQNQVLDTLASAHSISNFNSIYSHERHCHAKPEIPKPEIVVAHVGFVRFEGPTFRAKVLAGNPTLHSPGTSKYQFACHATPRIKSVMYQLSIIDKERVRPSRIRFAEYDQMIDSIPHRVSGPRTVSTSKRGRSVSPNPHVCTFPYHLMSHCLPNPRRADPLSPLSALHQYVWTNDNGGSASEGFKRLGVPFLLPHARGCPRGVWTRPQRLSSALKEARMTIPRRRGALGSAGGERV